METPVPIPNTEVKHFALKILVWRRTGKISTAKVYILKGSGVNLGALLVFAFVERSRLVCEVCSREGIFDEENVVFEFGIRRPYAWRL